jgi:hypothetical protein
MGGNPMGIDAAISMSVRDALDLVLTALTPLERWAATGRLKSTDASEHPEIRVLVIAVLVMVLLVLLLRWVSRRRQPRAIGEQREFFTESANRRGLSTRERQILLAIVVRSGLGQSEDIFTVVDAFDQGAAKLQEECSQTRTPDENRKLQVEIAALRSKLGFELTRSHAGTTQEKRPSSRDILVGQIIDLTRRRDDTSSMQAEVVRNDDIELAIELPHELEIEPGEGWLVRYDLGTALWEFDTTATRCEGTRLILNHSRQVRFVNRRRFPRLSVHVPAWVIRLPAVREPLAPEPPAFTQGTIIEMAGPGLRIEIPVQANVGDQTMVVFQLEDTAPESARARDPNAGVYTVSAIGRVQYVKRVPDGVSAVVELRALSEEDVDELVRYAYAAQKRPSAGPANSGPDDSAWMVSHAAEKGGGA